MRKHLAILALLLMLTAVMHGPTVRAQTTDKPASDKPASEKPASEKPASEKPASDKPATSKPTSDTTGVTATEAAARLILVTGAAGTEEYGEQFQKDSRSWLELAKARHMDVRHLSGAEVASKSGNQREQLQAALESAATELPTQLWIVLIGHGTSERGNHKFNLVGPDFSAKELNDWCRAYRGQMIVINCSSASAPFLPELSGPGRVIITATRSGSENNYSRFGDQLAASILDLATDIDHDDEVSLLEAFLSAAAKTEKIYKELSRLATEHALLDDNGDKLGTGAEFFRGTRTVKSAQGGKPLDGQVAARITLFVTPAGQQLTEAQQKQRSEVEQRIDALRNRKPSPPTEEYWNELEKLMLELSSIYEQAP